VIAAPGKAFERLDAEDPKMLEMVLDVQANERAREGSELEQPARLQDEPARANHRAGAAV
jgi:hypothetical protein